MPVRVLACRELQQALLPLLVALTLAIALGRLLVLAYAAVSGWPPLGGRISLGMLVGAAFVGALLVGTVAPVIRIRITLRRE